MDLKDFKPTYTDNTPMPFGKHKFKALSNVPAEYLLNIYYVENKKGKYPNKELIAYIEKNLEKIEASKGQSAPEPESIIGHRLLGKTVVAVCTATDKVIYPSEKDAKHEINKIKSYMQGGKKPERAYECEKCGGWHLTSIPHEQWEK